MWRLALCAVLLFVCDSILVAQGTHEIDTLIMQDNSVSGGGFQSDVTITTDGLTVYSSADVSGIFKSVDGGLRYENISEGLKSPKVATLAITPDNDQILYAGTGDKGGSGGLYRSTNGGDTWTQTAQGDLAQFAGNHSSNTDPLPSGHPRSNGDLIVIDEGSMASTFTDDIVIAGSYDTGVVFFDDGGDVKLSDVEPLGHVRALARQDALPNAVFAAIQFSNTALNGVYQIDYTNPLAPVSTQVYPTLRPEGLTVLSNGHVYAAIGDKGIVKYDGISWQEVNTGLDINNANRQWTAVTGYVLNGLDVVYAGTNNLGGNASGANYSNVWRTVNSGTTWSALVVPNGNVSSQILGQTYDWWYTLSAFQQGALGKKNSVVSAIDVATGPSATSVSDDIIYVSGRGGIWKSDDGGANWSPAVYNMQVTANRGVAVNPNNPAQVAIANTDYVVLQSSDRFADGNISRDKPSGSESRAYDIIFDAKADDLIIGVGDRDSNTDGGGEVYIKPAATVGNPSDSGWTDMDLLSASSANDGRVQAVSYGYHDGVGTTSRILLAMVEGEGVYRHHAGTWTLSTGINNIGSTKRSRFVWPDSENSPIVYLLDLRAGLYRSNDGGQTWVDIWPSMSFKNNDFFNTGYITADDLDPTTIYVSIQGNNGSPIGTGFRVYRMTNADTNIFGAPGTADITDISFHSGSTAITRPGPIVLGPAGKLWVTQQQNSPSGTTAGIFVMEHPSTDLSFVDLTTAQYQNTVIQPSGIDASSDGHVYISQSGTGLVKLKYAGTANMGLTNTCIDIYPEPTGSIYTVSGTLDQYDIDILDDSSSVYLTLCNTGPAVSIDTSSLPEGIFFIRVAHQTDPSLHVQKILKF